MADHSGNPEHWESSGGKTQSTAVDVVGRGIMVVSKPEPNLHSLPLGFLSDGQGYAL